MPGLSGFSSLGAEPRRSHIHPLCRLGSCPWLSSAYRASTWPHCLRFDRQITALVCLLTRCSVGSSIAINSAMTAITTNSSMRVNPAHLERFVLTALSKTPLCRLEILCPDRPNLLVPHIMALPVIDDDLFDQRPDYT